MRQLALSICPREWETLPSFVDRLAALYEVTRANVLRVTGVCGVGRFQPYAYGLRLPQESIDRFAYVTRLTPSEVSDMLLSTRLPGVVPTCGSASKKPADIGRQGWVYLADSHVCPACLRERGNAWHIWWKVPWAFMCVHHSCLLLDSCPGCGQRLGNSGRAGVRMDLVPKPGRCSHRPPEHTTKRNDTEDRCGFALESAEPMRVDSERLIQTQSVLYRAIDGDNPPFAGSLLTASEYLAELRSLASLLLHVAEPEMLQPVPAEATRAFEAHVEARERDRSEHPHSPRSRRYFVSTPRTALLMAAVLPLTVWLAEAGCVGQLRFNLRPLAKQLKKHSYGVSLLQLGRHYGMTPTIEQVLTESLRDLRPPNRFDTHAWSFRHHPHAFEPHHIPQLFWLEYWNAFLADILPTRRLRAARQFASLALVRLCWKGTWANAATALDLPIGPSQDTASTFVLRLNEEGNLRVFVGALRNVARDCATPSRRVRLIDYAARRAALATMRTISVSKWHRLTGEANAPATSRQYASIWLWAELTGGDPLAAPMAPQWNSGLREAYRRYTTKQPHSTASTLLSWGRDSLLRKAA